jgi:predicted nucleotidyltransferase
LFTGPAHVEVELRARGVETLTLTLFGSMARGDPTSASDVDLAVRPGGGFSSGGFDHFGRLDALRARLSALLGCDVDLESAAGDRTGRCACLLADRPRTSWISCARRSVVRGNRA